MLTTVEQKKVEFYDDELVAIRADDGHIYVSVRHLSDALGLNQTGQIRRVRRQPILDKGCFKGHILTSGGKQQANWLRVDLVPLFLTGVNTKSVKPEIQPKLERFQEEAAKFLWEAFQEGLLTTDATLDDLLATDSPAAQAYKTATALMRLARQQLLLENHVVTKFKEYDERLETIEATLGDSGRSITPDQASQLSQAVKAVAMILSKKSRRNEYGGVYGEMYRKFGITSYKLLPAYKFEEAMKWLANWYQSITDTEIPF